MKYLLIDSNNLSIRHAFSNQELKNSLGEPTSVHYGFMNTLINMRQSYPDYQILCVWDGKSKRRMEESESAVKQGLIKSAYKANRKKDEQPKPLLDFYAQAPFLKRALEYTSVPQMKLNEFETDDIIFSYCQALKKNNEVICLTSDRDYYQLLDDNVSILDGMKQKTITKDDFIKEYGIQPSQYVDVGSFQGDDSDNIFGVYGVGEKTALELIKEHGSYQKVLEHLHKQLDPLREKYPDLKDASEFKRLATMKANLDNPKSKLKYPEITINNPFTGVALALEDKKIKKISKSDVMILIFEERVKLAYSLKKMDLVPNLPEIKQGIFNRDKIIEYFNYFDIQSLKIGIDIFGKGEGIKEITENKSI